MRLRRFVTLIPLAVAIVLCTPGLAHAKVVPASATIEGDELAGPVHVDRTSGTAMGGSGSSFDRLVEQSGFFAATMALEPDPRLDDAPTGDLGPALEVTWRVEDHGAGDGAIAGTVRQLVYPHAAGGPLTYTEPGQAVVDGVAAPGGWYRAPAAIAGSLDDLGIPLDDMTAPADSYGPAGPAGPEGSTTPASRRVGLPATAIVAAAGLAGAALVVRSRRRPRTRLKVT